MNRVISKVRRAATLLLPARQVSVKIAGEMYQVVSHSNLRPELNDYDYAWLRELSRGKRCILDVGCSVGLSALMFTRHMERGGVCLSIDGSRHALTNTFANLQASGLGGDDVEAKMGHLWIGAESGATEGPSIMSVRSSTNEIQSWLKGLPAEPTKATLDGLCRTHDLRPDFIKIDIEGAEHDALRESTWLADAVRPTIQVELHTFHSSMREAAVKVLDWSRQSNYEPWYMRDHARLENPEQIADRGRCHVLLLPEGVSYPENLRAIPQGSAAKLFT